LQLNRTNISVKIIWDYYWIGNPLLRYKPYRFLRGFDLPKKSDAQLLSKATYVVNVILDFAGVQSKEDVREVAAMNVDQRDKIFEKGFTALFSSIFPEQTLEDLDKRRVGELTYVHVYDLAKDFEKIIIGSEDT
jgi:hypothetical protein